MTFALAIAGCANDTATSQAALDTGTLNVEVADRTGYASGVTNDGATVEYIGDQNLSFGSSGTGVFESFLRVQPSGNQTSEQGYNTNGTLEFDSKAGTWTHAMKVSDIPVVAYQGKLYWELFADINDSNSTPKISLNDLEVWFTSDQDPQPAGSMITGYPFASATKVYDFAGTITINDVNQGSGRGDLRYRIPVDGISIPPGCGYKNPACNTYFVLYTRWGTTGGDYACDGGFEEWKVKQYPYVTVTKTAATTFTRTFDWTIQKSANPATLNLFTGDSGSSQYTVTVTKAGYVDSNWAASGSITITNPGTDPATITSVTDAFAGITPAVTCPQPLPYALPPGQTLICTYSSGLTSGTNLTNTATVTLGQGTVFTGTAPVTFGAPTTLVYDTIHVTDPNSPTGNLGAFNASGSAQYERSFACDANQGNNPNTATITETGQNASASVTVNCYGLSVTKDATTKFTRKYFWDIAKTGAQSSLTLAMGQPYSMSYTVTVSKTTPPAGVQQDSDFGATGTITVTNPAPIAAVVNSVADVLPASTSMAVTCPGSFPSTIAANGGQLICSYAAGLPDSSGGTNTATATLQNHSFTSAGVATATGTRDYSGTAAVTFDLANPTTEIDECIDVTDSKTGVLGTVCLGDLDNAGNKSFTYDLPFGPYEVCGPVTIPNTATFATNDTGATKDSLWTVNIDVPCPPAGCTLTQGYWKTHSSHGPARYDDAWLAIGLLGADTPFFVSGQTYYQVLWTPVQGNAYYNLAHQYIAAKLNMLDGADAPSSVDTAFATATTLLSTTTPAQVNALKGAARQQWVNLAGILGAFNEGKSGVPHCSEDQTSSLVP